MRERDAAPPTGQGGRRINRQHGLLGEEKRSAHAFVPDIASSWSFGPETLGGGAGPRQRRTGSLGSAAAGAGGWEAGGCRQRAGVWVEGGGRQRRRL